MSLTPRKRKSLQTEEDEEAARAIFQKHFEAQFAPLPEPANAAGGGSGDEEGEDGSNSYESNEDNEEWGGISDHEDDAVEVVDHTVRLESRAPSMGKRELKAFMVWA